MSWPFNNDENPDFFDWLGAILLGVIVTVVTFYFILWKGVKILTK
jgi:hypothetical protein